jgi:hypothetical protein
MKVAMESSRFPVWLTAVLRVTHGSVYGWAAELLLRIGALEITRCFRRGKSKTAVNFRNAIRNMPQ